MFLPLAILCTLLMLYFASTKVVIVSAEEAENLMETEEKAPTARLYYLEYESSDSSGCFNIFCPDNYSENFSYSERIDKNTITLIFKGVKSEHFIRNAPNGDFSGVKSISEEIDDNEVRVVVVTKDKVYAHLTEEEKKLVISLEPVDLNETVVVLDPLYGGVSMGTTAGSAMEKEINLAIAKAVRSKAEGKNYRIVMTRNADETMLTEERLAAIDTYGADYYVGIGMRTDMEDTSSFGMSAYYNDEFYRNGFENVDFAEVILRNAAVAAGTRALSLDSAGDEKVILHALDIPGVLLYAGTITNSSEASLLINEEYIEKIAEGIVSALDSVVER